MKYRCVDTAEFMYPDIYEYVSGSDRIDVLSARNSYACGQILFTETAGETLDIRTVGFDTELYEMVAIHVEGNEKLDETNICAHQPERYAPYDIYDCIKPMKEGKISVKNGVCALYFTKRIEEDAECGVIEGTIIAGKPGEADYAEIPVRIEISSVVVPEETMNMIMGYSQENVCKYHHVRYASDEFWKLDTAYLKMLRRMHQNMLYCPMPYPIKTGENKYEFDFSGMEVFMRRAIELGYRHFNFGIGFRESWTGSTIMVGGMPSMSFECYCYLAQMLPKLVDFLKEHGWIDCLYLGIADEPNEYNATEFRALCSLVRKFAPEIKLMDAMSFGPVHGAIDIWVPLNLEYQIHRTEIETFRSYGDDIWFYDCCGPRGGGFINRFLDYPLISTRYHFWAGYLYNLNGYLHWAANNYMPGQNPFEQSCPEHHNADQMLFLPPGDTHIMYPGEGEPWMSVRMENYRASAEEFEMFKLLAKTDKEKADTICQSVCRSFSDVDYDVRNFRKARNELIRALEK